MWCVQLYYVIIGYLTPSTKKESLLEEVVNFVVDSISCVMVVYHKGVCGL